MVRTKAKYDPAHIFVVAEQYRNGSKWLIMATTRKFPFDVKMAGVTCSALALELFLKCMLAIEGKEIPISHDLLHLFNRIGKANQNKIRANYAPYLMVAGRLIAASAKAANHPVPEVDFDFVLKASRQAFPLTRYIYERGLPGGQGWLADGILEATRTTILGMHPEWENARQASPAVVLDHGSGSVR